jgi:DNA-binding NtrC family response regulator
MLAPAHEVTVAKGGLEAEALLLRADAPFDVIVCDLAMPDMPGAELFERVCARRPELSDSFVFMTGGLVPDAILERSGSARVPRLEKPFSAADVAAVIERVLERGKNEGVFDST